MWLIMIVAVIFSIVEIVKEKTKKPIPRENFGKEFGLLHQDILNGVDPKVRMKRLRSGYYIGR